MKWSMTTAAKRIVVLDSTAIANEGTGRPAQFSQPTINALRAQGHEVTVLARFDPYAAATADVVWTEWANDEAFIAASSDLCKRLVIRVRGFEVWGPFHEMNWANVHALVFESPFIEKLVFDQLAELGVTLPVTVQTHVIPAGVDLTRFPFEVPDFTQPTVVALVARAVGWKGYQLAFEWARSRPDVMLYVSTACEAIADPGLIAYLDYSAPSNVVIHGDVDTPTWLREIGAQYLLSASIWETLGYTVVEAMALGLTPLVHDTPAVKHNWKSVNVNVWRDFADLNARVCPTVDNGAALARRRFVESDYDSVKQAEKFAAVLFTDLENAATVRDLIPIQGNEIAAIAAALGSFDFDNAAHVLSRWRENLKTPEDTALFVEHALRVATAMFVEGQDARASSVARALLAYAPNAAAFVLLGKIAERAGKTAEALMWFKIADVAL